MNHRLSRVRWHLWPALQTAFAAVVAWYLAGAIVDDPRPSFASIAAVIAIGAAQGERPSRARELMLGVIVGLGTSELLVRTIGNGPLQTGGAVLLAMLAALLLGSGLLLVSEAGVSAILMTTVAPSSAPIFPTRPVEALVGVGVALAVTSVAFPMNPGLHVGRAANGALMELAVALEAVAGALERGDAAGGLHALESARALDGHVRALEEALALAGETARLAPARRAATGELRRYAAAAPQIDLAVRDARILARHAYRLLRAGGADRAAAPALGAAARELEAATWALAGELDGPERESQLRAHAGRAAARAADAVDAASGAAPVAAQVRSIAADLLRGSEAADAREPQRPVDPATDELLAAVSG